MSSLMAPHSNMLLCHLGGLVSWCLALEINNLFFFSSLPLSHSAPSNVLVIIGVLTVVGVVIFVAAVIGVIILYLVVRKQRIGHHKLVVPETNGSPQAPHSPGHSEPTFHACTLTHTHVHSLNDISTYLV